jgi:thiosulfate/3-mercaptopyruvate sulfurtransferase
MRTTLPSWRWLTALAALLLPLAVLASPLLTPDQLAQRLGDPALRVIDIRDGKDDNGRTPYELGHIAGSVPAPYSQWRGPSSNPGLVPAEEKLTNLVQSLGIGAETPVVIAYAGNSSTDFGAAARVYWTLKAGGVKNLAILNGGIKAWTAGGQPLVTEAAPQVAKSDFVLRLDPRFVATRDEVKQAVASKQSTLLDARPARFFSGETRHAAAATPGTIAGAKNVDNAVWFAKGSAAVLDTPTVQKIAQDKGIDLSQPTVSFCNTGHWAATNWFVLSEVLGQKDVKMYPESIVDWSNADGEMENVPGRLSQFWLQIKEATGNL